MNTVSLVEVMQCHAVGDAVMLIVDGAPQQVFELGESLLRHARDEYHGNVRWKSLSQHLLEFFINEVTLSDGEHAWFLHQVGIESSELIAQNLIFSLDVVGIARYHEQQHSVTLNVTQEAQSQAFTLTGALDDTGDVGHHKRLLTTIAHDAQVGLKSGKWIVSNLGLSSTDY